LATTLPPAAAVKVVVATEEGREAVRLALAQDAARDGFRYAHVDSAKSRVHLVHQFVSDVASQLPWTDIAKHVVADALRENTILCRVQAISP
jgi:pyridoxine/pyridoxamine 5'-phosphate oxidase